MGESIVEDKMGERDPILEVSVSFGRFENDSLSWEKFSSFSPNKYLDEVGKCATPGSVAQKKAYFEAHYKKIGVRKIDDEKEMENDTVRSDHDLQNNGDDEICDTLTCVNELVELEGIHVDKPNEDIEHNIECYQTTEDSDSYSSETKLNNHIEDVFMKQMEEVTSLGSQDMNILPHTLEEETQTSPAINEELVRFDNLVEVNVVHKLPSFPCPLEEETQTSPAINKEPVRFDNLMQVSSISNKEKTTLLKKKHLSPMHKASQNSTLRMANTTLRTSTPKPLAKASHDFIRKASPRAPQKSNPQVSVRAPQFSTPKTHKASSRTPQNSSPIVTTSLPQFSTRNVSTKTPYVSTSMMLNQRTTPSAFSAPRLSTKKGIGSSSPTNKNHQVGEIKKVAPKSLHMSLSFDSPNTGPSLGGTRRTSFIMEKMGDKDIVKRAFKTFQNSFNQLKVSSEQRKIPAEVAQKVSNPNISRREKEGSLKAAPMDRKTAKGAPLHCSIEDARVGKQKESSKKFAQDLNVNKIKSMHIQTKSKVGSKTLGL